MLKNLYSSIKSYFSSKKTSSYQIQNPEWFTPGFLEEFIKSKEKCLVNNLKISNHNSAPPWPEDLIEVH